MRDDVHADGRAPGLARRAAGRVGRAITSVPWRNALSIRWWWRWFNRSQIQTGRLTALLVLFGLLVIHRDDPPILQFLRARVFDFYQQMHPRTLKEESPVIVVDIDEKSLQELGVFPWPRHIMADLVDRLTAADTGPIGFDIVWPESDPTSISAVAKVIPETAIDPALRTRLESLPSNDTLMAESFARSKRVVSGQTVIETLRPSGNEGSAPSYALVGGDPKPYLERHTDVLHSLPELEKAAAGRGIFSVSRDSLDGIVRQVPMVLGVNDGIYPSLTLEMLRLKLRGRTVGIQTDEAIHGVRGLFIRPPGNAGRFTVSTDRRGQIWVYFRDHRSWEPSYISATDVIHDRVPKEKLQGKFILVGTSAQGTFDLRASPLDAVLPGVEMHANILENIAFQDQIVRPPAAPDLEWLAAAIVGLIMITITPMLGAVGGAVFFLAMAAGVSGYSWNAFTMRHELYDPVFAIGVALSFYIWLTYVTFLNTERSRKQVRSAFGQYLSPDLVKKLADDPSQLKLGGENREMTFMFSDIRGFSGISELFDAQGLTRLINRLLTPLTNAILKTNGTIDKYMGDCVMAFWNAPLDVKDHQIQSCRSALDMVNEVKRVNTEIEAEAKAEGREHRVLAVGIGVNSGIACVGNMGSQQRFDYSVLGDNVNLASRLEGQSKTYHVTIVLGEATALGAKDFAILELDLIKVKGKTQAVRIFTLLGDEQVARAAWFQELRPHHDAMLAAYRTQEWGKALAGLSRCRALVEGQTGLAAEILGFYDVCEDRIAAFRASPPPADWDGVYVAESK